MIVCIWFQMNHVSKTPYYYTDKKIISTKIGWEKSEFMIKRTKKDKYYEITEPKVELRDYSGAKWWRQLQRIWFA